LNIHGAITVNYFKLSLPQLKIYIGNVVYILLISFTLTGSIIYIFKTTFSHLIKFPDNWLPIVVIIAFFQFFFTILLTLWRAEQKSLPYGIFQFLQTILNVGLSIIFVVALKWRWQGRLTGIGISCIIFGILGFFIICRKKYIIFSFNKEYFKDALFFGVPLIPHALGGWVKRGIDRIFLNSLVSVAATGIYTVGYQVGMIIGLLTTAFNNAWSPFLFEKLKENDYSTKKKIVKFTYLYFVCIIALALALSFIAPFFLKFFVGKSFHSAYKYVLWIALGYAAHGMYLMVVNYIFYVKKTYILAWLTLFTSFTHIILNYFLIKAKGPIGAAQATTFTFFVSFVLTWILSSKVYKMPWNLRHMKAE